MKLFDYKLSTSGASLMELTIAIGVLSIATAVGMSLTATTNTANSRLKMNNVSDIASTRFKVLVDNSQFCYDALKDNVLSEADGSFKLSGSNQGKEISIRIENLGACNSKTGEVLTSDPGDDDCNTIPLLGIKIDKLYLKDAVPTGVEADGKKEYVGRIFAQISKIQNLSGGQAFRPRLVGGLLFNVETATGNLAGCRNTFSPEVEEVCKTLDPACVYVPEDDKPCQCPLPVTGCPDPGTYPVDVVNGTLICKPLGGGTCPEGQIMTGMSLNGIQCTKVDAVTLEFRDSVSNVAESATVQKAIFVRLSEQQMVNTTVTITPIFGTSTGHSQPDANAADVTVTSSFTLNIPAGAFERSFNVRAVADGAIEVTQSMTFSITSFTSGPDVILGGRSTHTLNIGDTSAPPPPTTCTLPGTVSWSGGRCSASGGNVFAQGTYMYKADSSYPNTGAAWYKCVTPPTATLVTGDATRPISCVTHYWKMVSMCFFAPWICTSLGYIEYGTGGVGTCPAATVPYTTSTPCPAAGAKDMCTTTYGQIFGLTCE